MYLFFCSSEMQVYWIPVYNMKLLFVFPCNKKDFVSMPSFSSHFVFDLWSVPLSKMVAKFKYKFCMSLVFSVSSFYVTKPLLDCCFHFGLGSFFALFWVIVSWSPNCIDFCCFYLLLPFFLNFKHQFFFVDCLFLLAALVGFFLGMLFYKKKKVLMARVWRYKSVFHCSSKEFMSCLIQNLEISLLVHLHFLFLPLQNTKS